MIKTNNLVKKTINGGIPAIENKITVINNKKNVFNFISVKE